MRITLYRLKEGKRVSDSYNVDEHDLPAWKRYLEKLGHRWYTIDKGLKPEDNGQLSFDFTFKNTEMEIV